MKGLIFIAACLMLVSFRTLTIDPCLKEVDAIFKSMYGNLPQKGKVVYVNYDIVTTSRPQSGLEKEEVKRLSVKTYATADQYRFISDDIEVYQDKQHAFTVIPSRKIIYWAETGIAGITNDRVKQMKKLQDTLFTNYRQVSCTAPRGVLGATKLVTLFPNKRWSDLVQIASVEYYLDSEKKQLIKQVIQYTTYKKLKSVEYIFKETDYDYKDMNLSAPVKDRFISKSKLVAAYSAYQLVDVRKNKK